MQTKANPLCEKALYLGEKLDNRFAQGRVQSLVKEVVAGISCGRELEVQDQSTEDEDFEEYADATGADSTFHESLPVSETDLVEQA